MFYSGVYGHDDYEIMLPLVLMHLPSSAVVQQQSLYHCLPADLQSVLNVGMIIIILLHTSLFLLIMYFILIMYFLLIMYVFKYVSNLL